MAELLTDAQVKLAKLAKDLKAADKNLHDALKRNIKVAAAPLIDDAKREAAATLPKTGGAADRVSGANYTAFILAGRNPGVRLRGREKSGGKVNLRKIDIGILRHPLFGDRNHWYNTAVPPGFWTRPMKKGGVKAEAAVNLAVDEMAVKFYGH